jgi:hypothetical protein
MIRTGRPVIRAARIFFVFLQTALADAPKGDSGGGSENFGGAWF